MNYSNIVNEIIKKVGGKRNISDFTNCMTRLRVSVINLEEVGENLDEIEGILGIKENGNELQFVFGPGKVKKAYNAMKDIMDDDFERIIKNQKSSIKAKRTSKFQGFMSKFSNIFVPLIPGFIAVGMLAGIASLLKALGVEGDFLNYISVFNKALLKFMYIMIGYNAAAAFGGSGVIGGILGGLFLLSYGEHGTSGMVTFFGNNIDPRGGLIGVLITAILSAKIEIKVKEKFSWEATDIITTPIITLLLTGTVAFLVIMPLSYKLFNVMNYLFAQLNGNPIGGGVLAGLFLPSVMMGIHQGFVPVYQGLVETTGMNSLFPILAMAGAGQVGASLALYVKSPKDSKLRKNIRGAIIPGFLGIGEPLIYGVTLPRVKPFITSMLGGAVGGVYIGILAKMGFVFGLNTVFGSSGVLASLAMKSNHGILIAILLYLSALVVAYIAGFILTYLFGTRNIDLS